MARRGMGRFRRPLDLRTFGEGISYPGIDPRQWISYATVDAGNESIQFDPDFGYLIECTLQPSKVQVTARVGGQVAGNGEADYPHPFMPGDEVLVAIPGGNERQGCVILCRLNNSIDKFPTGSVAGQDPTLNAFGFRRQRTPFIHEVAGPYLLRQATTGALLSFDTGGTLTIRDSAGDVIQMGPDQFSFQDVGGDYMLQLDTTNGRFTLKVADAILTLSSSTAIPPVNAIGVNGLLTISAGAQPAAEHAISTEAVVNILFQVLTALSTQIPGPVTGVNIAAALLTILTNGLTAASQIPMVPPLGALLQGLFLASQQKPPAVTGFGQTAPGIGCPSLIVG